MKYQELTIQIDSPYKWGQGWTSTREASDAFNDNLMGIVAELGMDINMSHHGVVQGNEFGAVPSAYLHQMELVFKLEIVDELSLIKEVTEITNIVKEYSLHNYTITKIISRERN